MNVVIAGGHGQIALRLSRLLCGRGHRVVSLVRNPDHVSDVRDTGASAAVVDLETASIAEVAGHVQGTDAVVFAAGAGPGSGAGRKDTVDRAAALLLAHGATAAGVRRYLLVSATGVDAPPDPERGEVWAAYITAKKQAEDALRADPDLDATILRPGHLTDDEGTGRVRLVPPPLDYGDVTRDDTAAVLAALLDAPDTAGATLELRGGDTPIADAVSAIRSGKVG